MELVYVLIDLDDGAVRVWSSLRGELHVGATTWRDVFGEPILRPVEPIARTMIHFVGDYDNVTDSERMWLMERAREAGYGVARIIEGAPFHTPEDAWQLLALPFT